MKQNLDLKAGEWIEIRSKGEILQTLDKNGQLDGLPFMPQMFNYCGKRFRVFKRAHKTCDTVFPVRGRRMISAVHLETRCDGQAYGGCQAGCLLFWKDAWLKRVGGPDARQSPADVPSNASSVKVACTEEDVWAGTRLPSQGSEEDPTYVCQATRLPEFTQPLEWWHFGQYLEDYTSGNTRFWRMVRGVIYATYYNISQSGLGLGRIMHWVYDRVQAVWGGIPFPRKRGTIPVGQKTPGGVLNLQPGELVRVKPYKEILATLDKDNKNRGLFFDAEAVPFCGGTYRVASRVTRILDEKTGKLLTFKNASIILEGVYCQSRYSDCRMFCPRAIYSYWREIWLERVEEPKVTDDKGRLSETSRAENSLATINK